MLGVQVTLSEKNMFSVDCANNIFNKIHDETVEGVYVIATDANKCNTKDYNNLLTKLDAIIRQKWSDLK